MKKLFTLLFCMVLIGLNLQAQTIEEVKAKKAEITEQFNTAQAEADALKGQIAELNKQIDILSGWSKGFSGIVGFDFNKSNNWISSPNPDASTSSLNLGLTAFANKMTEKTMWRNKGIISKSWQDVDLNAPGTEPEEDGLFDNGAVDILNISSLYGYRVHPNFAISALGELNTSVENFLAPGNLDFGVGGTWTPSNNLVVVVHPLNYNISWPADGSGIESRGALGAKLRADYTNTYTIAGKDIALSSTLTTFLPYSSPAEPEPSQFNYTWINNVSFTVWNGIGVGAGFGLRNAEFESPDTQTFYTFGLSYSL